MCCKNFRAIYKFGYTSTYFLALFSITSQSGKCEICFSAFERHSKKGAFEQKIFTKRIWERIFEHKRTVLWCWDCRLRAKIIKNLNLYIIYNKYTSAVQIKILNSRKMIFQNRSRQNSAIFIVLLRILYSICKIAFPRAVHWVFFFFFLIFKFVANTLWVKELLSLLLPKDKDNDLHDYNYSITFASASATDHETTFSTITQCRPTLKFLNTLSQIAGYNLFLFSFQASFTADY